jgi:hypothetical protein
MSKATLLELAGVSNIALPAIADRKRRTLSH